MRTQGFRTHVVLVLAGTVGLVASLGRDWYGRAPHQPVRSTEIGDVNGPLYGFFHGIERWVTDPRGVTGWHALGMWATLLAALAGIAALSALAAAVPALQGATRDALRWAAFGVVALVAWRLVDPPHANAAWELRNGALIAAGAALMLLCGALPVANAPRRRQTGAPAYAPPPPPAPAYDTSGSVAPPGS